MDREDISDYFDDIIDELEGYASDLSVETLGEILKISMKITNLAVSELDRRDSVQWQPEAS